MNEGASHADILKEELSRQREQPRPKAQGRSRFGMFKEQQKSQGDWKGVSEGRGVGTEVREVWRVSEGHKKDFGFYSE